MKFNHLVVPLFAIFCCVSIGHAFAPKTTVSVQQYSNLTCTSLYMKTKDEPWITGAMGFNAVSSAIVIADEFIIYQTKCGALWLDDTTERIFYLSVILVMSTTILSRILARADLVGGLELLTDTSLGTTSRRITQLSELLTIVAVIGAFLALGHQYEAGSRMDGLSGIDISYCRAIRDFR